MPGLRVRNNQKMSKVEYGKLSPRMSEMQRRIEAGNPNRTGAASASYRANYDEIFKKKDKKSGKKS